MTFLPQSTKDLWNKLFYRIKILNEEEEGIMKITVVLGSPRKDSISTKIAMDVIKGAKESGHEIVTYKIEDMDMLGCQACGCCRKYDSDCVIEDDLQGYFKDLRESGALIVASPNYYSQVIGPMITFMNRHYCLLDKEKKSRIQPGIKLIGIFAQGAPAGYEKYQTNYDWYLGTFLGKDMELAGKIIAGGDSDTSEGGKIRQDAYVLGKGL